MGAISHRRVVLSGRLTGIAAACLLAGSPACLPTHRQAHAAEPAPEADALRPAIRYTLTRTGKVALVVDDAQGRRVRNLIAEADRPGGENREPWDGRDDHGRLLPPGEYSFTGAVTPPLRLIYEFTLNNAGDPPWWKADNGNPMKEKGGWMSDHSPPTDVATHGDLVFLGADATEHGNSLNVVDLDGRQVWATRWLSMASAKLVAGDDRWVYAAGEGHWIGNSFKLFVLSPRTFSYRQLAGFGFDDPKHGRGGGLVGLAAHGGKVAAAFNGKLTDATTSAVPADRLDFGATTLRGLQPAQAAAILRAAEPLQPWVTWPLPRDGVLRLAWKQPRPVGTVLSPHRLEIAMLRPRADYPGDPARDAAWEPMEAGPESAAMNVYTAVRARRTRALRVRVLDAVPPRAWSKPERRRRPSEDAPRQFAGLRLVEPRLRDLTAGATFAPGSGTVFPGGAWENAQGADITPRNPATYTVRLPRPVTCRALVVRDPFFVSAEVETQQSPGGPWIRCGGVTVGLPWRRAYTEATFDFHRDTTVAALRLKVTRPATDQNYDVKKRTGGRRNVCSLGGVALLGTRRGDPPVPPDLGQRITVFAADEGRVLHQIPIAAPGAIEFAPDGRLLAISGTQVVHVPLGGGAPRPVIREGLVRPTGLTVDAGGRVYVSDSGDHVVKRFTPEGRLELTIGKPGGLDVGPYDPAHMSRPAGLALDSRGRLWVAEHEFRPKKVSVWSLSGAEPVLAAHYLGPAPYGGGFMYVDPRKPSRFFFQGMEFEADWETGKSRIKNIVWRGGKGLGWGGVTCDRPIYHRDRLYLAAEPHSFYGNAYMAVAQYDAAKGQAVPVAAAGMAGGWPPLRDPEVVRALGTPPRLGKKAFVWSDLDCDGRVQAKEIQLSADEPELRRGFAWDVHVGHDLALQFARLCLAPVRFLESRGKGVPVYSFDHTRPTPPIAGPPTRSYGTDYHGMGVTRGDRIAELSSVVSVKPRTGQPLWTYPAPWPGTQMSGHAPSPRPGLVAGQLGVIGGAVLPGAGEVVAIGGNKGEIYVFTIDGLFVARLFRDHRYGRNFNFPKAVRGMEVGDASINCEHFGGTFTQLADGRIILVVGHNHNSVVRVEGLDRIRRFAGKVELTAAQYLRAEREIASRPAARAEPRTLKVTRAAAMAVDGRLDDWPAKAFVELKGAGAHAGRVALAWDAKRLLLAYAVRGRPELQNGGNDWTLLFKSGDSVDLQLGTDPKADRMRQEPVRGDLRLVLTVFKQQPVAVLYRYRAPDADPRSGKIFKSPVGSVTVDSVERIPAETRIARVDGGYTVEAAVPWKSMNAPCPRAGDSWLGDVGILFASEGGGGVAERLYWSNRDTGLVADVPGEIRLRPSLWGTFVFE